MNVKRDYAGGMGVADPSTRPGYGHDRGYITLPYMSLLYTTAILERAGHDVRFIDAQADGLGIEELVAVLRETGPDAVVSVVNLPSIYGDMHVLNEIKDRIPDAKTIAIGTVCAPLFDVVAESGCVDAVVQGDPEAVIEDLVDVLCADRESGRFHGKNGVLTNTDPAHIADLDALPDLPYHLVPLEKYWYHGFGQEVRFAALFASRGCSFKCYYCPYPMGFGGCIVHRDPVRVVDEIERLQRDHGVEGILFRDQVFSMEWEKTHRLCDEIMRRGLKLKWVVETRLDRVNEELLRKMKAAGCVRIHYGLESGDPKLFSRVGKDGAEDRMEQLIRNFSLTEKVGIHPHMFVLLGLLGENWKTIDNTIGVIRRIKPVTLQVAVVTPYPGTELYDEIRKKNLLLTDDWSQYTGFKAVARTEDLSKDDLITARRMIINEHQKAVFWKKQRQKVRLFASYLLDGSLIGRLARHARHGLGAGTRHAILGAKRLLCAAMYHTGAFLLYRAGHNQRHGDSTRILSVHRVIDTQRPLTERDTADLKRGCLSLTEFAAAIEHLRKHYEFVPLQEVAAALAGGAAPPHNGVVLTFDDAFKDVIQSAYPVLKRYEIPFTIFITADYVGQDRMLTREDILSLARDPLVSWGAHGLTHRWVTNMALAEADAEIKKSKDMLEELTGKQISLFCYPDGKFSEVIAGLLKEHGFVTACSTTRGLNTKDIDLFALKRIPFESEPLARFAMRMAGMM